MLWSTDETFLIKLNIRCIVSEQQALNADPKAIQQINFTVNLDWAGNTTKFFIIEEAKGTIIDFSQELWKYFNFILCYIV